MNYYFTNFLKFLIRSQIVFLVISSTAFKVESDNIVNSDFGAVYTHIQTNDDFERTSRAGDYADIIFDLGKVNGKLIFWIGNSYLPYWESNQGKKIMTDEIIPRSGNGTKTMPDKVNASSVVKIIENTSQKVVNHWRFPLLEAPDYRA